MRTLPTGMIRVLAPFAPLFSEHVFEHVQVLIAGTILAPGKRTVSSALRAMGLDRQKTFHRYHRVLSRAKWSSLEASRVLLDIRWWKPSCPKDLWWWAWMSARRAPTGRKPRTGQPDWRATGSVRERSLYNRYPRSLAAADHQAPDQS